MTYLKKGGHLLIKASAVSSRESVTLNPRETAKTEMNEVEEAKMRRRFTKDCRLTRGLKGLFVLLKSEILVEKCVVSAEALE